jgi:hypothetical protein
MANTVIQLKYSTVNQTPTSLNIGEPAYSFTSDKLFIGNAATGVLTIGGKKYVDLIEANTSSATPETIVIRDEDGSASFNVVTANSFSGNITGTAATADKLTTGRDIGLSGDATGNVTFDGSDDVTLAVALSSTGVVSGDYGGSSNIAVFNVGSDGRITSVANVSISTNLTVEADTGSNVIALATDTLTFVGGDGITTSIDPTNNVKIDVDNTVIRSTGNQLITGDLEITGNLLVSGNTISIDSEVLRVNDSIILLANNNIDDAIDIGFTAHYGPTADLHTGLVRHAQDKYWYLFENYEEHFIHGTNTINIADPTFVTANLVANIRGGKVSDLTQAIAIADGGTNATTFTTGNLIAFDGTSLISLANTGTAGTYGNSTHVPVITTDAYGRVSSVTNTAISIDAASIGSGTLAINRGGTNNTTYTTGALLQFDGTSISSLANSTYTLTGALSAANTITSLTVDDYGRVTAATGAEIAIEASQITGGILGVERGGSGANTFTTNGVLLGQGTGAFTTASSSTEGHVLTINSLGVPTFEMLSGGTF